MKKVTVSLTEDEIMVLNTLGNTSRLSIYGEIRRLIRNAGEEIGIVFEAKSVRMLVTENDLSLINLLLAQDHPIVPKLRQIASAMGLNTHGAAAYYVNRLIRVGAISVMAEPKRFDRAKLEALRDSYDKAK